VHPASLRGEGISLAVHDGCWQACRRATDGSGRRSSNVPPRLREARASSHFTSGGGRVRPHLRFGRWRRRSRRGLGCRAGSAGAASCSAAGTPAGQTAYLVAQSHLLGAVDNRRAAVEACRLAGDAALSHPAPSFVSDTKDGSQRAVSSGDVLSGKSSRLSGERPPVRVRSSPLHAVKSGPLRGS
jgi:hypothetical protein